MHIWLDYHKISSLGLFLQVSHHQNHHCLLHHFTIITIIFMNNFALFWRILLSLPGHFLFQIQEKVLCPHHHHDFLTLLLATQPLTAILQYTEALSHTSNLKSQIAYFQIFPNTMVSNSSFTQTSKHSILNSNWCSFSSLSTTQWNFWSDFIDNK